MPTLAQVRTRVNNYLANTLWPEITGRQYEYYQDHGRYWQGLKTHSIIPNFTDTTDASGLADLTGLIPSDQPGLPDPTGVTGVTLAFSGRGFWGDFVSDIRSGIEIEAALRMDVYHSPFGKGYVGTIYISHNGTTYYRSQNYGPEEFRTQNWSILETGSPF